MLKYTFFIAVKGLVQDNPEICESKEFEAVNDIEATEIASRIFESCDDVASDYWLWGTGNRLVATNLRKQAHLPLKDLPAIMHRRQQSILEVEETLQAGSDCMARSKSLLEAKTSLRSFLQPR